MTTRRFRLQPDALLSVPVFSVALLWGALVQVGEWAAFGEGIDLLAERLALLLAVQVLMFAFPFLTLRLVCPQVPKRRWNALLLVSVVAGSIVRGIAFGLLLFGFGVSQAPDLVYRVIASLSHLAVITVLMWFLVSEVRSLTTRRRQLLSERDQLLRLQQESERDLAELNATATDEIRRSILESLGGLQATDASELLARPRATIDDVVRPLSHHLASQQSEWRPPEPAGEPARVGWSLAVREGLTPARIHPVVVPLLLVWLGIPIHLFQLGPIPTLGLIATLVVTIPIFALVRLIAMRVTTDRGPGARAAAFVIAVAGGGLAVGLGTLPYMQDQPQPLVFPIVGPILSLLISGALAIGEAARDQDLALEAELRATTADLRWSVTRARERYRQHESALSRALHGRLQASLSAAFIRLDRALERGFVDDDLIGTLRHDILTALAEIDVFDSHPDPIDDVVALTRSNWADTVSLIFTIDDGVRGALAADALCARSVNDLVPELVFNSVRHGNANVIDVQLKIADHRTLCLTVMDDGSISPDAGRHGLGSALLDEASICWTRTRSEDRTTTSCRIPCLSAGATSVSRRAEAHPPRERIVAPPQHVD